MAGAALKNVNKIYPGGAQALFDLGLTVKDGEFLVLLGPEKCGKSSVLRVLAGLEEASTGEVEIGGAAMNGVAPKDRDIAMVFQNAAIYPQMSVADNMGFGLKLRKVPQPVIDVRVREAAALLGLTDVLGKKVKQLTALQRQRTALGATIVREPKLVLLDEPLSGLDQKLRVQMRGEIAKLQARLKNTFVYATKDPVEAVALGSRIVVMKDGFMQQADTAQNLYDYPVNLFVADFLGSDLEIVRNAELVEKEGNVVLKPEEGADMVLPDPVKARIKEGYIGTGKKVTYAFRPEDKKEEGDLSRILLFDGETDFTVLGRDDGYETDEDNAERDFLPPTPQEMKERSERLFKHGKKKK